MPLARECQYRGSVLTVSHFAKLTNNEQGLAELDRLPVFDQNLTYGAAGISVDFIEQFHGFDDAQGVAFLDHRAYLHEGRGARRGGAVEGCLLYTSPSPRDRQKSRMPSSA